MEGLKGQYLGENLMTKSHSSIGLEHNFMPQTPQKCMKGSKRGLQVSVHCTPIQLCHVTKKALRPTFKLRF